ncbi:MAG: hypothetical protein O2800_01230 [Planctomycetota bacterium]|nr:hypothetical protein [Planctomycetota bacterium]
MILGWIPFLQPLDILGGGWWILIVPLVFGIAMVHRSVRCMSLSRYWGEVVSMTATSLAVMALLAIGIWAVLEFALPAIPV